MSESLKEFNELCREAWDLRIKADEAEKVTKGIKSQLEKVKYKIMDIMEAQDMSKTHVEGFGTLSVQQSFNVTVPKGDDKMRFFDYLKEKEIFEELATVNSMTLNSWYKQELEVAAEEGRFDFTIPGIGDPKLSKQLKFRKA